MLPSVSSSCSWGVPRCCLGSLQSWDFLRRLPWSTLLTPSFSAQALREWRRADGFCTFRPLVRVRVCAAHSVRCLVLRLCVCTWTCQFVLSCRGSLRCLFLWASLVGLGNLHPLVSMVSPAFAPLVVMALLTAGALSITFVMDPAWFRLCGEYYEIIILDE